MALLIDRLETTYPNGVRALDQVSLDIPVGMFGLLGPNGAGKSTLMRILATLQRPDRGVVHFHGLDVLRDPMALRRQLGYLPQSFGVYPRQRGRSLLLYLAALKGIASKRVRQQLVDEVLEKTNLVEASRAYVSDYSGGMKQRFGIAQLLLNRPRLIIVDEPTAGLDPQERKRFLNVLRGLGTENTVIFSTHLVEDVNDLCQDMAIIARGRILKNMPPRQALAELAGRLWTRQVAAEAVPQYEASLAVVSTRFSEDHEVILRVCAAEAPGPGFVPATPNLEDAYFITLKAHP